MREQQRNLFDQSYRLENEVMKILVSIYIHTYIHRHKLAPESVCASYSLNPELTFLDKENQAYEKSSTTSSHILAGRCISRHKQSMRLPMIVKDGFPSAFSTQRYRSWRERLDERWKGKTVQCSIKFIKSLPMLTHIATLLLDSSSRGLPFKSQSRHRKCT